MLLCVLLALSLIPYTIQIKIKCSQKYISIVPWINYLCIKESLQRKHKGPSVHFLGFVTHAPGTCFPAGNINTFVLCAGNALDKEILLKVHMHSD